MNEIFSNEGLWGIFGIIIGSSITFFSQCFFEMHREKMKNRILFINQYLQIQEYIFIIKNAINQMINITEIDIEKDIREDLKQELFPSIIHFSEKCNIIWSEFRTILFYYFYKIINNKSDLFYNLDNVIIEIINLNNAIIDVDIFINNYEQMKQNRNKYIKAIKYICIIEEEYNKIRKKILVKKI